MTPAPPAQPLSPTVRAFIAIELPAPVKAALARWQDMLGARERPYVKWVDPERAHLTLKFLGNVDARRIPEIAEALDRAVAGLSPFGLRTGLLGAFPPNLRSLRVIWVGLGGELARLEALYQTVEKALVTVGFPPEGRPFSPHLTLGRVRDSASPRERGELGASLGQAVMEEEWKIVVDRILVMKSELSRGGARYSLLHASPLASSSSDEISR